MVRSALQRCGLWIGQNGEIADHQPHVIRKNVVCGDMPTSKVTDARDLARVARRNGIPVNYANDNFGRWQSDFSYMVKSLQQGQGTCASIARLLRPRQQDLTVLKPMHSAFYGTPLDISLGRMGVRTLVLAGLATDICIQLSVADAFLRGLRVHGHALCRWNSPVVKRDHRHLQRIRRTPCQTSHRSFRKLPARWNKAV